MKKFYLIITHEKIFVYREGAYSYDSEYFDGDPYFFYSINRVKEGVDKLEKILVDNNNLASKDDLEFTLISSGDPVLNAAFIQALGNRISKIINLNMALSKIILRLNSKPEYYIKDFGVNYDGRKYAINNGQLESDEFSLLAYPLTPANIFEEIRVGASY